MTRHLGLEEIPDPGGGGRRWVAFALDQAAQEAERARAEQARREREAREAAERARRAREERIRRLKQSWNQGLTSYRGTEQEEAARFVFKKLNLNLDDDRVGEKFYDRFWDSSKTVAKIEEYFIDTVWRTFDGYQFKRYEKLFSHLSCLFGDSKEQVLFEIARQVGSYSFIKNGIDSLRDENIHQRFKEFFGRGTRVRE